ncbi:MAG: SCO family protein [Alphaproteobacteria bacterium]
MILSRRWGAAIFGALLLISSPITASATDSPFSFKIGGPFSLADHDGNSVTDGDFRGRFMLIYFGYTYCPDICPTNLQVMGTALSALGAKDPKAALRVTPVFVTIDPERDTSELLKEYVANFHPNMVGLRGDALQTKAMADAYRMHFLKVVPEGSEPEDYLMNHSSITFLMGPEGELVTLFPHDTTPEKMEVVLGKYLSNSGS